MITFNFKTPVDLSCVSLDCGWKQEDMQTQHRIVQSLCVIKPCEATVVTLIPSIIFATKAYYFVKKLLKHSSELMGTADYRYNYL